MTPNEIIGSLVYRTCGALNGNASFMEAVKGYYYSPALVNDGVFHLWHFPGTAQEISHVFQYLSKDTQIGSMLKFPAILNFQGVIQEHNVQGTGLTILRYNLAIITPVRSEWTTQQREEQAYKLVLRPIEREFIRQIQSFRHFQKQMGDYSYTSLYVPTTGKALNSVMKIMYGDFIDAIEMPNLVIKVLKTCDGMSDIIIEESRKVTDEILNLKK